ncbi:MAG: bifunctional glutamate N-acetyltransferase/amino-acid acetyltransferase ArgJ [bacterium]|nr:bifunctional glutamate N-acetyltransferase/amino-acid acetyltransferase ArgJ [bacterium]MXV89099.1 bifunctional glutamate N-acetyltransferase/amino-acid acetyltransferase ArgJ [Acidimicrobiia bacterium]MYC46401.1 bifunctional glutamate N-acetyltransferase/amino-acid acetyltransferase ArgJ [Acidimicrobiia bacterium]MYI19940.1 bifunctional glutamate N-acetyltransferase/amino-acid acetyltransferase ArgJ [Acidimicrobiia bacterium]
MSVTSVEGFVAAGITAGIKPSGAPDMSVVATADGTPVAAAGVFTSNKMTAAPVVVTRSHLERSGGLAVAVILNSGNANAATGQQGLADAERMCELSAESLGCDSDHVLVCSTGLIGFELPMDVIAAGIPRVVAARRAAGGGEAARAMMTTDTVPKEVTIDGGGFTVGGIAKGAAMLEPNMATMLAVLTTDAAAEPAELQGILRAAVATSFNRLTVDGAESTNDTVLLLANGLAGPVPDDALAAAIADACGDLALQMADDAEGSTKTVLLRVTGAASDAEAAKAARDCANCQLVKCSWFGEDPYWGRIASEFGAAGVAFDPERITIAYGGHVVYAEGRPQQPDAGAIGAYMRQRRLHLNVDLGLGDGRAEIVTVDLSHGYIDENSRTS